MNTNDHAPTQEQLEQAIARAECAEQEASNLRDQLDAISGDSEELDELQEFLDGMQLDARDSRLREALRAFRGLCGGGVVEGDCPR
jgi:prefoldin subunit 5